MIALVCCFCCQMDVSVMVPLDEVVFTLVGFGSTFLRQSAVAIVKKTKLFICTWKANLVSAPHSGINWLLLAWACNFQNNLNMHAELKYLADLKYFGKLALKSVTLGCLLTGLCGRHSLLHGFLDCHFACSLLRVLFDLDLFCWIFCFVLGLLVWVFVSFLSFLRFSNFVLAVLPHLHDCLSFVSVSMIRDGRNCKQGLALMHPFFLLLSAVLCPCHKSPSAVVGRMVCQHFYPG